MLNNRNHCCRKCQTFNEPYHRRANSKTIKTLSFSMTQNISCLQNAYVRILRATVWIRPRIRRIFIHSSDFFNLCGSVEFAFIKLRTIRWLCSSSRSTIIGAREPKVEELKTGFRIPEWQNYLVKAHSWLLSFNFDNFPSILIDPIINVQ